MYQLEMKVQDEHIDFQGIMDGLYYPFYMEECRHKYIKDVLGADIVEYAKSGINMVLIEYTLKFKSSLKKGDAITVSCDLLKEECSKIKFAMKQTIVCNGKTAADGVFFATCVSASGGLPFIPESILAHI